MTATTLTGAAAARLAAQLDVLPAAGDGTFSCPSLYVDEPRLVVVAGPLTYTLDLSGCRFVGVTRAAAGLPTLYPNGLDDTLSELLHVSPQPR